MAGARSGQAINVQRKHELDEVSDSLKQGDGFDVSDQGHGEYMSLFPTPWAWKSRLHHSPEEAWEYIALAIMGKDKRWREGK